MKKKVLILGSSGQIGAALCNHLKPNYDVIEFDIASDPNQDLRRPNAIDEHLKTADFVFFLAFDVGGSLYLEKYQNTKEFIDNNMMIMLNVFDSLARYRTPFIFASSQMANMSYSNYGLLKSLGEKYTSILDGLLVKFWNVYGIENDPKKFHVITDFINAAKSNGVIHMRTSGQEERQFLHADDCSRCLEILMNQYYIIPRDKNLHVTNFEWTKIIEVAEEICKLSGATYTIGNSGDIQQNKRNEPDRFILNLWQPEISLSQGIKQIFNQT